MAKMAQLTGLRFVAALVVFFFHLGLDPTSSWFARIFDQGYVGVSFFFVLSGFVLSYSYKQRLLDGLIDFKSFLLLRAARLAPPHILTALALFPFYSDSWQDVRSAAINILLLQSWVPNSIVYFSLNVPSWSLSDEMFFYMMFCAIISLNLRRLGAVFFIISFTIFISAVLCFIYLQGYTPVGYRSVSYWVFYIFPAFRLLEFVSGMLIYQAWRRGYRPWKGLFIISILFLGTAMSIGRSVPEEFRYSLFYLPFVCLLLFSSLRADAFGSRWLSSGVAVFLGNASFAFYLLHYTMISYLTGLPFFFHIGPAKFIVFSLPLIVAASSIFYLLFEKPIERYLREKVLSGGSGPARLSI